MYRQLRIDVKTAPCGDLSLGLAYGGGHGIELAVAVAERNGVLIDQRQLPDAGTAQRLGGIAAHTAQTEYRHMAAGKDLRGSFPQQHFLTDPSLVHRDHFLLKNGGDRRSPPLDECRDQPTYFMPESSVASRPALMESE